VIRVEGLDRTPLGPAAERVEVVEADITKLAVDAIVNAANTRLAGGGGVDGAIHRAAGPGLAAACRRIGGCPTGEARITPGFDLPARWIIHAVGPVWHGGRADEAALLAGCYRNALHLAAEHGVRTIAFPAISCGAYGYPLAEAAAIAVATVVETLGQTSGVERVYLTCFGADVLAAFRGALAD
jgi:O-acetyl-ADP-ribose deacetylase (regulator of RNase III)